MSIAALNWAWSQDCPTPTSKLVLLALADKANDEGECWPTMGHVAEMAGVSSRQVSTHLSRLEEAGLIRRRRKRSLVGHLGRYTFRLNLTTGSRLPVDQEKPASTRSALPVDQGKPASGGEGVSAGQSQEKSTSGSSQKDENHRKSSVGSHRKPASGHKATTKKQPSRTALARKHRMPDGWQPNDQHRRFAADEGLDLAREQAQFADYHAAKGSTFVDWDAAFRTWLRNAVQFGRGGKAPPSPAHNVSQFAPGVEEF